MPPLVPIDPSLVSGANGQAWHHYISPRPLTPLLNGPGVPSVRAMLPA